MDESFSARIFSKITIAIFVIALIDLFYINWWILKKNNQSFVQNELSTNIGFQTPSISTPTPSTTSAPDNVVLPSGSIPSPSPTIIMQEKIVVQTAEKEVFIPLGTGYATSSTYSDLNGVEVTVDSTKYPNIEGVYFEAAISVEGGNGRAYAQIYNVNDKVSYIESQISNNTSTATVKYSNRIPIATGAKTYRVQAKNEFGEYKAYVDNARLKIVLK